MIHDSIFTWIWVKDDGIHAFLRQVHFRGRVFIELKVNLFLSSPQPQDNSNFQLCLPSLPQKKGIIQMNQSKSTKTANYS